MNSDVFHPLVFVDVGRKKLHCAKAFKKFELK